MILNAHVMVMYLNIINNINHESKRKSKKIEYFPEQDKNDIEDKSDQMLNDNNDSFFYYSVFYGDLTKNWINLRY